MPLFLVIFLAVFLAVSLAKDMDTIFETPLVWPIAILAGVIMYPFIWASERHLPKNKRTPLW